jgi:DNA-binding response OmpR family regulator
LPGRIMIVDDEPETVNAVKMVLEHGGFQVLVAVDGEEAIQKAEAELPDIILLDKGMPGKNGVEVCKILKSQEKTRHIVVLMFTASGQELDEMVADAGADGRVAKPFHPEELLAEVNKHLGPAGH